MFSGMEGNSRFNMKKGTLDKEEAKQGCSFQKIFEYELAKAEVGEGGLLDFDAMNTPGIVSLSARSEIPPSHRRIADSFVVMKNFYGTPVVQGVLSFKEKTLLEKYDFNRLEYCTIKQINEELAFLQSGSVSMDANWRNDCDEILKIRAKELKFLAASKYAAVSNEMFNGYLAVEKYFEKISSYNASSK